MDKKVKRIDRSVIMNIIQYLLIIVIGVLVMYNPEIGILEPVYYISIVFYVFSFITCLCYFIGRRKNDYENLLLSLINVIIASFLFLMQGKSSPDMLGISVSAFTILVIFNKMYSAYQLKSQESILWGIKYLVSLLLAFLGLLTMFNLFNEVSVVTLMFGYYFISFGIVNLIEPVFEILFEYNGVKKFLMYIEDTEVKKRKTAKTTKEEKEVKKVVKEERKVKAKKEAKKTVKEEKTVEVKKEPVKEVKEKKQAKKVVATPRKKNTVKVAAKKVTKKVVKKTIKQPAKRKVSKTSKKASK